MQAGALISYVEPYSPADDAGFYPGCIVTAVDGHALRDIIDWRWYSDSDEICVSYVDGEGDAGEVELMREEGEPWGFDFEEAIFDEMMECRNACTFCFMRQLPAEARKSLSLRDDDYRLSFLQGNFVTFTNVRPEDEARIVEQHISPLRFSLHCVSPEMRRSVIGKHAAHGMEVAQRLLDAGIELHAQIVLMPGVNDGEELVRTLEWAYGQAGIRNVGIVPLGFTKHQSRFSESFNDPDRARAVIESIVPFQERAMAERGEGWVHAADEFYSNAYGCDLLEHIPPAAFYGDFEMFEDGIGIIRSFADDWMAHGLLQAECARKMRDAGVRVAMLYGRAMEETLTALMARSPLEGLLVPLYVDNGYFGGNVDVTGLMCGCDMLHTLRTVQEESGHGDVPIAFFAVPRVVFNADGVTLDDMTLEQLRRESGVELHVVSCVASEFLQHIVSLLAR